MHEHFDDLIPAGYLMQVPLAYVQPDGCIGGIATEWALELACPLNLAWPGLGRPVEPFGM